MHISQIKAKTIRTCMELQLELNEKKIQVNSSKIKFVLRQEKKDIYNITPPFSSDGKTWIAGRVESRDNEYSRIGFFEEGDGEWVEAETEPIILQDPFVTRIRGELILGGVEVFDDEENPGRLNYRTVFYRGDGIWNLTRFASGPDRMKDIRLCEMEDGRILAFTRPQGEKGGRGKIGWCLLDGLEELTEEKLNQAVLMEEQFMPEEWGGANQLHRIGGRKIGVLSHIARFDEEGNRHYYSTAFCFDPETGEYGPMKMIAERKYFQPGPSKRPDLEDVIFSGGLLRLGNGKAELYCGVGDAEGQKAIIDDPFDEYENEEKEKRV